MLKIKKEPYFYKNYDLMIECNKMRAKNKEDKEICEEWSGLFSSCAETYLRQLFPGVVIDDHLWMWTKDKKKKDHVFEIQLMLDKEDFVTNKYPEKFDELAVFFSKQYAFDLKKAYVYWSNDDDILHYWCLCFEGITTDKIMEICTFEKIAGKKSYK